MLFEMVRHAGEGWAHLRLRSWPRIPTLCYRGLQVVRAHCSPLSALPLILLGLLRRPLGVVSWVQGEVHAWPSGSFLCRLTVRVMPDFDGSGVSA